MVEPVGMQARSTAKSSAQFAMCGSQSEKSSPDWPYLRNLCRLARSLLPPMPIGVMTLPKLAGKWLAVHPRQFRLRIDEIDVARPAFHEEEDDRLGRRREVRLLGQERIDDVLATGAALASSASMVASARAPKPWAERRRKSRRARLTE